MAVSVAVKASFFWVSVLSLVFLAPRTGKAAVAPVGQLPSVAVSVTPSVYALPVLLVEDRGEWKDFGIQIDLKVHAGGEEQLERIAANEWEVAVMDPYYAVKGGNDGDVAVVGVAGNFASQLHLVFRPGASPSSLSVLPDGLKAGRILCPVPSLEYFWINAWLQSEGGNALRPVFINPKGEIGKEFSTGKGDLAILRSPQESTFAGQGYPVLSDPQRIFLPACLAATSTYADTRKTLVMRWSEGYSRGIRIIQKDPARAASRLRALYQDKLKVEVPEGALGKDIQKAFVFEDGKRDEALTGTKGKPGSVEIFAKGMTDYLDKVKAINAKKEPGEYILGSVCDQISRLRQEAESQMKNTRAAIDLAGKDGAAVQEFQKKWEEARAQMQDGRGCLTVIGILSDLQRSAEQTRAATRRLNDFRSIELGIGLVLALYYAGYFVRRRKTHRLESRVVSPKSQSFD